MVGETVHGFQNVGSGSYLEAKPAAGVEWVIHNIYHPNDVRLKIVDSGGNECEFLEEAGKSFLTHIYIHLTSTHYLRIYNISGGAVNLSYDGIVTLEP